MISVKPLSWIKFGLVILLSNFKNLRFPYKLFLVVTKSCGSRCGNCFIWKEAVEDELTVGEYQKMAKSIGKHLYWLNISGGEPTDRKDIKEIISAFVDNCPNILCINFTTNALNLSELMSVANFLETVNVPVIRINVSVDGPEKIHDKIRGTPGGYKKAVEALKFLHKAKKIKAMAAMTLFDSNMSHYSATFDALKAEIPGFKLTDFHVNLAHASQHYYGNELKKHSLNLSQKQISRFLNSSWFRFPFPSAFVENVYRKKVSQYLKNGKSPVKCTSMSGNLYVSEKGSIYPCTIWNKKIDDLRLKDFSFEEIITSPEYASVRKEIMMEKCPGCWTPCEAYPSILSDIKGSLF